MELHKSHTSAQTVLVSHMTSLLMSELFAENYFAVKRVRDNQLDTKRTTKCGGVSAGDM